MQRSGMDLSELHTLGFPIKISEKIKLAVKFNATILGLEIIFIGYDTIEKRQD